MPRSIAVLGEKPRSARAAEISAKVSGTLPGCMGCEEAIGAPATRRLDDVAEAPEFLGPVVAEIVDPVTLARVGECGCEPSTVS